ncbi:MAG: T9SS type A sorting domain-containing protein [Spirochaetales bacterium]|nr:T9SS type A sorting domain-containing protein [Spirochaetales bacterium]
MLATAPDQTLAIGDYTIYTGCAPEEEDFKWRVTEDSIGEWIITIDLENETIVFDYQEATGVEDNSLSKISVYPNPAKEYFTIDLGEQSRGTVDVFSIDGRIVYHKTLNENRSMLNVNEIASSGLLILRVSTEEFTETFRLLVQ